MELLLWEILCECQCALLLFCHSWLHKNSVFWGGLGHDRFGIPPIRLVLLRHLSQLKCIPRGTWHSPCGEVIMEEIQGFIDLLL